MTTDHLAVLEELAKELEHSAKWKRGISDEMIAGGIENYEPDAAVDVADGLSHDADVADKQAERLRAAIALMRGQSWQPIETAPKNEPVIVVMRGQQFVAWFQDDESDPEFEVGFSSDWDQCWLVTDNKHGPYPLRGGRPTHWQPLPAPPAAKQERDDA